MARRMQDSELFNPEELADHAATGETSQKANLLANQTLQAQHEREYGFRY